jgi:hypothetical protein
VGCVCLVCAVCVLCVCVECVCVECVCVCVCVWLCVRTHVCMYAPGYWAYLYADGGDEEVPCSADFNLQVADVATNGSLLQGPQALLTHGLTHAG